MKINNNILKVIHNILLIGTPYIINNPINNNKLYIPLEVKPYSTYLNFKLDDKQSNYIKNYIKDHTNDLSIIPIKMSINSKTENYISVNIYNCSSPIFLDNKNIIRCEVNTYVKNKMGKKGTLILDYVSDGISMDPINIFKNKNNIKFKNNINYNEIYVNSNNDNIKLLTKYTLKNNRDFKISDKLIKYTDDIYYKNGIFDKVYYDTSLVNAKLKLVKEYKNFEFKYKDLEFNKIDSLFYFENSINFIGSMWNNI